MDQLYRWVSVSHLCKAKFNSFYHLLITSHRIRIGSIPDAVLAQLTNHKDLGVHSEMFSDGVVDLFNLGCITNKYKVVEQGKIVSSFLNGTKKLYDFADDNPFLTMRVIDWTNKEFIIAQNPKIVAINSCIEIDLVGQVCADSIGTRVYSGFGGQGI